MTSEIARSVLDDFHDQWPDARSDLDPPTASLIDALLEQWDSGGEARLLVEPHDEESWTVGIRIPDRLGTLSVVSGLFTNSGLDIVRADTFTLVTQIETRLPVRRRRRRGPDHHPTWTGRRPSTIAKSRREHALIVFRLRSTAGLTPDWEKVRRALESFANQVSDGDIETARAGVIDRFAHKMRRESSRDEGRAPDGDIDGFDILRPSHAAHDPVGRYCRVPVCIHERADESAGKRTQGDGAYDRRSGGRHLLADRLVP